ncbi:MAG: hypothetical protein LUG90_12425 [Clostridiaceae bacterium]|nr:hypothetical protein [Clostridiaceae bacterium]
MKRTLIVIMAVCAALAFTACGKSASNTETTPAPAVTEPETKEPATTPAATLEAPGDTAEFKILTCDVVSVSDTLEDMTVKNGDAEVKFNLNGVVIETSYELKAGIPVSIIYKGEISGDDAANAAIVLVLDAQEDMEVKTMTGSVTDQAMSSFTIRNEKGEDTGFLKDNCEGLNTGVLGQAADDSNGSGAMVKVTYVTVSYDAGSEANFPLKVESAK